MRSYWQLPCVVALVLAAGVLIADDDQTEPSPYYMSEDIQYFPAGPETKMAEAARQGKAALGELLFTDVVSVHFVGPGHPANPDGSLGGLVLGDYAEMKIYERYIVREITNSRRETFRELHPYETLGKIEQRFVSPGIKAKQKEDSLLP